jgi:mannose-6-phosphate isomerase-like protein (cupin superfamily)
LTINRPKKVNLQSIVEKIAVPWSPINIARVNEGVVRIVKIEGEFTWHSHLEEDEFFLIMEGNAVIQTEKGDVELAQGEGVLIPRGLRHCTRSEGGAVMLVFEPWRTKKEGDRD